MSAAPSLDPGARRDQLAAALERVHDRIRAAALAARRDPREITLIAVTKYHPITDIEALVALGHRDIAENKDQEARAKVEDLPAEVRAGVRVHFVGQLQTNKARSTARYADVVHSVDRERLATALGRGAERALEAGERQEVLDVLIQVGLDRKESASAARGGAAPEVALELASRIQQFASLRLRGVMGVAPHGASPEQTAQAFETLADISRQVRTEVASADWISAGMSQDLESAVAAGATHLRVGSAILGSRPLDR